MAFNLVQPAGRGSSRGDIQYGQEVTTTPSPSIRPAYLITAATPGTLPLGLDHIKPISVRRVPGAVPAEWNIHYSNFKH